MRTVPARNVFNSAEKRWAGVGPYYAMFPTRFADLVVKRYTERGDWVLDPFAGRGTALFSAATQGRFGVGIEINPVGWVYGRAKLQTASKAKVEERIRWLGRRSSRYAEQARNLPFFFRLCFCPEVRRFLLAARNLLNWRRCKVDWTTMALILVDLHGKRECALSNQLRQTKAMSPPYAIRWWQCKKLGPPKIDPVVFMLKKASWRYGKGRVRVRGGRLYLGDSRRVLPRIAGEVQTKRFKRAKLLLTSPPYCGITNYFYDQWIRLWLLGGPLVPKSPGENCKRRFENQDEYLDMLRTVFNMSKPLLRRDAILYVRTDAREFTLTCTIDILKEVFPKKKLAHRKRSTPGFFQTSLFCTSAKSKGEVDLVFS